MTPGVPKAPDVGASAQPVSACRATPVQPRLPPTPALPQPPEGQGLQQKPRLSLRWVGPRRFTAVPGKPAFSGQLGRRLLLPSRAKFTGSPESPGALLGSDPHAPLRNATCDSLTAVSTAGRGGGCPPLLQVWHLVKPNLGLSDAQPTKHQGCLALTRIFINAGRHWA